MKPYEDMTTDQLIKEINRYDKKILNVKTELGLWALECGIKTIRAELEKRIQDPELVTKMIVEGKN